MANGETLKEIRALVDGTEKISPSASARLTLSALADLYERVDDFIEKEYKEDHKKIEIMWPAYKIMVAVSSILGVSVVALIWALITGQAEIIFK